MLKIYNDIELENDKDEFYKSSKTWDNFSMVSDFANSFNKLFD